jgi:hypothetical protein
MYCKNINLEYLWRIYLQNNNFKNRFLSCFYYFQPVTVMYVVDIKVIDISAENYLISLLIEIEDLISEKRNCFMSNLGMIYIIYMAKNCKLLLHP